MTASMAQLDIVKLNAPSISMLNAGTGSREAGITAFEFTILELLEYFHIEWSEYQIREVSEVLFGEYYYWSIAELKHFIMKVKAGNYGKIYGKLAPGNVVQYAGEYNSEVLFARAGRERVKSVSLPDASIEYLPAGKLKEGFTEFLDTWGKNLQEERQRKEEEQRQARKEYKIMILKQYCAANGFDFEKALEHFEKEIKQW